MRTVYFVLVVLGSLIAAAGCGRTEVEFPVPTPVVTVQHAPTCAVQLIAPYVIDGANFFGSGTLDDCSESDWDGVLQIRFAQGSLLGGVDIDRSRAAPGNTLDIGAEATAFLNLDGYAPCEGTVTWKTDEPDWSVAVDATCGLNSFVGNFHGHVYNGNN